MVSVSAYPKTNLLIPERLCTGGRQRGSLEAIEAMQKVQSLCIYPLSTPYLPLLSPYVFRALLIIPLRLDSLAEYLKNSCRSSCSAFGRFSASTVRHAWR